jgi:hypothetical protein
LSLMSDGIKSLLIYDFLATFFIWVTSKFKIEQNISNMKKFNLWIIALVVMVGFTACHVSINANDKEKVSSVRKVKPFDHIIVDASCDVHYVQGDSLKVEVIGNKIAVNSLITTCEGNTLNISVKRPLNFFGNMASATVYITTPDLVDITMRGAGDFEAKGRLDTDTLHVNLIGCGDLNLEDVICDEISTMLKGTGDLNIRQLQCNHSMICLLGTGDVDVNEHNVATSRLILKGVGDMDVNFNNCGNVDTQLYGVGDITLKGNVKYLTKSSQGTGDISISQLKIANK